MRFLIRQVGDLLLGVLVTVALFLVVEGCLRLFGAGGAHVPPPRHLAAGFDPSAAVFEPHPELPGAWRGRYSHDRSAELVIPAKGKARRVLLLGGSNTASFEESALAEALGEDYEVLNLGRAGYGSTRVAILLREALERLEPDVVVVYSGHNEFVEKSFAMDLEEAWDDPVVAALARGLEATVTGRLLSSLAREDAPSTAAYGRLADWEAEYQKFKRLAYEETLAVWDAYEANLRYMGELAAARDVPLLLCTPVWNRLSPPRTSTREVDAPQEVRQEARRLRKRARRALPAPLGTLLPEHDQDRVHSFDWAKVERQKLGLGLDAPLPGLRPSSGWLAEADPEFTLNEASHPKVRGWYEALDWLYGERTEGEQAALSGSEELLAQALESLPDSAALYYELALVRYAQGQRGEDLREALERAARQDRAPRKANPHSNARVRRVAEELSGVTLFDADARFAAASPDGLVGWEWMVDHCHLSHGAGIALLRDMAGAVEALAR